MTCADRQAAIRTNLEAMRVLVAVEVGEEIPEEKLTEAVQVLADSGYIWVLPGRYGRLAQDLIDQGLVHAPFEDEHGTEHVVPMLEGPRIQTAGHTPKGDPDER